MSQPSTTWLTQDAYDRIQARLDRLLSGKPETVGTDEATSDDEAQDDDPAHREKQIERLRDILSNAKVGEMPPDDGVAEPGMVLTVRYHDTAETHTFLLATRTEAAFGDIEVYSPQSPLGQALNGARQGESREYALPNGSRMKVTLVSASPFQGM